MSIPSDPSRPGGSPPPVQEKDPLTSDEQDYSRERKVSVEPAASPISSTGIPTSRSAGVQENPLAQHFSGDAIYFIEDDTQRQQVLQNCRQSEHGRVITLRSPADLDHHNLLHTITCQEGLCHKAPGRLFGEQPITLVLDLTVMSPGQIASLNDLLAKPHSFFGKPLGKGVRLVALVSPSMLEPGPNKPGPDCWRRLQTFPALFHASEQSRKSLADRVAPAKSNDELLQEQVQEQLPKLQQPEASDVIDFTDRGAWRTRLFGGLALDDRGKFYFRAGQLAGLSEEQTLTLQDAPWDNPDFTAALATVLREGGFEANGVWVNLPGSLRWFRQDTSPEELALLKQKFVQTGTTLDRALFLNPASLEDALCDTQIHDGIIHSVDTLKLMLSGARTLYLTQPLSDAQWLRLLRRLERLDHVPRLVDLSQDNKDFAPVFHQNIQCQVYRHETQTLEQLGGTHKTCRVTAQTQWGSLWQETGMTSQNEMRFEIRDTPLLELLKQGKPVAFHGLETAPGMMANLESLLAQPPYLYQWPEDRATQSQGYISLAGPGCASQFPPVETRVATGGVARRACG
ncbi:MAG: hypothetical protein ACR2PT_17040 [Endozoicomonas sp.]